MPTVTWRCLADSGRFPPWKHRQIDAFAGVSEARVDSLSVDPAGDTLGFPVQVDGDYIGDHSSLELGVDPGSLTVVA
jgi:diacylglycerol kinase family enzyme